MRVPVKNVAFHYLIYYCNKIYIILNIVTMYTNINSKNLYIYNKN